MKKLYRKSISSLVVFAMLLTAIYCHFSNITDGILLVNASALENSYDVLVLNFDPIIPLADNKKQHELIDWWNDPNDLALQFKEDMYDVSHGYANYNIVDWVEVNEMPRSTLGKQYTVDYYYNTLQVALKETDGGYWSSKRWEDYGFTFDYDYYMSLYNVYERVNNGQVDEVWIFTGPMVGVTGYESHMIGRNAYWCNSPGREYDCKPFVVYCFNYERDIGCMLENAGHRFESVMNEIMGWPDYTKNYSEYTDWEKFTAYDLVCPGKAGVGNVHFSPNSLSDYDWGNETYVLSFCNDWVNYPSMSAEPESVNCSSWGMGDQAKHHKWWFNLIPHAQGIKENTSFYNNWWIYFTLDYINNPLYVDSRTKVSIDSDGFEFEYSKKHFYTGYEIRPSVNITYKNVTFKNDVDYTISYTNNVEAGTGKIIINGRNILSGSVTLDFTIVKPLVNFIKVTAPNKIEYYIGDELDVSGGKITVSYSDDKEDDLIDIELNMCTDFDSSTAGQKTVTVTYEGKTATFDVIVKARSIDREGTVIEVGTGKECSTLNDALKRINLDIKNKTADIAYTLLLTDNAYSEKKAITFPAVKIIIVSDVPVTISVPSISSKSDLLLDNITFKTAKGINAAVNVKKSLTAVRCSLGKVTVSENLSFESCKAGIVTAKKNVTIIDSNLAGLNASSKDASIKLSGITQIFGNVAVAGSLDVIGDCKIIGKFTPKGKMSIDGIFIVE